MAQEQAGPSKLAMSKQNWQRQPASEQKKMVTNDVIF